MSTYGVDTRWPLNFAGPSRASPKTNYLVCHSDATSWRLHVAGDKVCDTNATFRQFLHCGLIGHCNHDFICNNINGTRTTVVRHSRECLATVVRHSYECLMAFVRISLSFIFSQVSREIYLFLSQYIRICIGYSSYFVDRGNYYCDAYAKGSRRNRNGFAIHIFVAQKVLHV